MKIVLPPVYERKNDPDIDGESDFFQRRGFSENLTRLFQACNESLVISIDSEWGDGKTSFVMKWAAELEHGADFIPIYYDAYKNDFTNDAFLSIATAIREKLERKKLIKRKKILEKQLDDLKGSMAAVATDMLKLASGVVVNNLTGGLVNGKDVSERTGDAIGQVLSDGLKGRVDQKLEAHEEAQKHIDSYRAHLKQALEALGDKKIVFFVDELDRCRPDFSIQVIEKIKHLFDVKGVYFVLSVNRRQLLSVIRHAYGVSAKDAEVYFQKFIHLETKLPSISRAIGRDEESLKKFLSGVLKSHDFDPKNIGGGYDHLIRLMGPDNLALSPRAIERVVTLVAIVLTLTKDYSIKELHLLIFVSAAIRIGDPNFYFSYYSRGKFVATSVSNPDSIKYFTVLAEVFRRVENIPKDVQRFSTTCLSEILGLIEIFDFPEPPWSEELDE